MMGMSSGASGRRMRRPVAMRMVMANGATALDALPFWEQPSPCM